MRPLALATALVLSIGTLLASAPAKADPAHNYYCWQEYQFCLNAGYDPDMCRDNYWYCRYGYYPVKGGHSGMVADRRR